MKRRMVMFATVAGILMATVAGPAFATSYPYEYCQPDKEELTEGRNRAEYLGPPIRFPGDEPPPPCVRVI